MKKKDRHSIIKKIITEKEIETQEELSKELLLLGFDFTQATISRDIKEIGLVKKSGILKKFRYVEEEDDFDFADMEGFLRKIVLSYNIANNLIVIKTIVGNAGAVSTIIDKMNSPHLLGSVAGDDTLLVIAKTNEEGLHFFKKLKEML